MTYFAIPIPSDMMNMVTLVFNCKGGRRRREGKKQGRKKEKERSAKDSAVSSNQLTAPARSLASL